MAEIKKTGQVAPFTPEQMELVQQLINSNKSATNERGNQAISRFTDVRDPKELLSCPVYRFDEKFVLGFKDHNNDPYRKAPKYSVAKFDINRKLPDQPFVTLLLSSDGKEIIEREVPLIDYMNNRTKIMIDKPNFEVKMREVIQDHGIIGRAGGGTFADDIGSNGVPIATAHVKAETKTVERTFVVKLPGFDEPVTFIEAFLA